MFVENGAHMKPGVVEGTGRLILAPNGNDGEGKGAIRVKIIPVTDD
jgi:hypothetical protein